MSGIQVSGLLSNSAFDWKSIVDQLVQADSAPITKLNAEKTKNAGQVTALAGLKTTLSDLQDAVQSIRAGDLFASRNVISDTSGTTWKSNSASGTPIGSYKFAVTQLATATQLHGAADIGAGLAGTSDVSGLTLATLRTGTPVTAGTFTVNGRQVSIALTDSLQNVFNKISTATGGDVTASYDPTADGVTLTSAGGSLVLGAANDTTNFLQVMKLGNNGTGTTSSFASLGAASLSSPLATGGLKRAITAVDGGGNGSFSINGVTINYNVNTDSLGAVISNINRSTAGVSASYDAVTDRLVLANKKTGDMGLAFSEASGGLLAALGATTGSTLTAGKNALFRMNDGAVLSSASNTLDAAAHGISGLSVTVNSESTQTVQVQSDTGSMQTSIQTFMDKFNAVQDFIETNSKVTVSGAKVTTSVLSDNREVQSWGAQLRSMAFDPVSGATGDVQRLDSLGIDFDSTTGHLTIKASDKLTAALANHPDDVQNFFLTPTTGMVPKMFDFLTTLTAADNTQQAHLTVASTGLDQQIADLQSKLNDERQSLTDSFIKMLDAQSAAQSQTQTLTNAFFSKSSN